MILFALGVVAGCILAALAIVGALVIAAYLGEHPLHDDPPPPFLRSSDPGARR
jgi:hypothetical protein